jgi:hypothetical protein
MALNRSHLLSLSPELLDEIVAYLPQQMLLQLLLICQQLQPHSARQIYKSVKVTGPRATLCFSTISSPDASLPYGKYIRSLTYIVTSYEGVSFQYQGFCTALAHTPQLTILYIDIPFIYSSLLVEVMYLRSIIRSVYDYNGSVAAIPDPLPNLVQLHISGDLSFIELASFRAITNLRIETIDSLHDVQTMLECLTDNGSNLANTSLVDLSLTLSSNNAIEIVQSLHEIGRTMRSVKYLSIYNHNINALVSYLYF